VCGIFAIINNQRDDFDYQSFCTLGVANDRRGGDSCGIFIDGKTEYGIDKLAKFEDFFWDSELLNTTTHSKIALGHCRKASPGMAINLKNAHPIVIEEDVEVDEGEEPRKEIKFVMVHNGTIHNYEELAKKFIPQIDIKGMTDSQVLARLIYYSGFDFLAEYNGGTAFIAVDYRKAKPEILLWRGESKKFSTSTEDDEERPLFANFENDRLVVSSIPSYLAIVDQTCYLVPANQVLTYHDDRLWIKQKIDRSKASQTKKYDNTNYNSHTNYTGQSRYMRCVAYDCAYYCGSDPLDGKVRMTTYGRILSQYENPNGTEVEKTVWFFNGIPLHDVKCYKFLCKAIKRTGLTVEQFCHVYQNFIRFFSFDQLYKDGLCIYKATSPFNRIAFTGYKQQLAEASRELITCGKPQYNTVITSCAGSFDVFKEERKYDYKTIWKEFIQSMG
jgi:hypothetical protein